MNKPAMTPLRRNIITMIGQGYNNKDIAEALCCHEAYVRSVRNRNKERRIYNYTPTEKIYREHNISLRSLYFETWEERKARRAREKLAARQGSGPS